MQYIFPLQATSFIESLEWKTDILESENGQEDALKVRDTPRQEFALQAYAARMKRKARSICFILAYRLNGACLFGARPSPLGALTRV